jgi:hypothetical protein
MKNGNGARPGRLELAIIEWQRQLMAERVVSDEAAVERALARARLRYLAEQGG